MTDSPSDRDLLRAAGRGDEAAFEVLYGRHRDWVYSLSLRFARHREDALDTTQEAFIHLARKAATLDLTAQLRSYLYPVVRHIVSDRARKRREVAMENPPERAAAAPPDGGIDDLLAGLSEAQRETVTLRFVDGFALDEIAAALEIPVGTVKSRLHDALEILRRNPPK